MFAALGALGVPAAHADGCKLQMLELPVHLEDQRAVATVEIGGNPISLLVDSGSFTSFLTRPTAVALHLRLADFPSSFHVQGYTGEVAVHLARVPELTFRGKTLHNVEFAVGGNEPGPGIQGILGRNFLAVADTEYDLAHGVVRLVVAKDCGEANMAYWAGDAPVNVVDIEGDDNAIRVVAEVNGHRVDALMDTGAVVTSVSRRAVLAAGVAPGALVPRGRVGGAGTGRASSWTTAVDTFKLGGEQVRHSRLEVDDVDNDEQMLIGIDYFLSHRIYVSRAQGKLYSTWNGGAVFALNKSGDAADERGAARPDAVAADDADGLARRGEAELARGDLAAAFADLQRASELAPAAPDYLATKATIELRQGRRDDARRDIDAALRLVPGDDGIRLVRARLRSGGGDPAGALEDLRAVDAAVPDDSPLRLQLAEGYDGVGRLDDALREWTLWLASHPRDGSLASVLDDRCRFRLRHGLPLDAALEDCEEAVRLDDESSWYRDSLGWVLLRLQRPKDALRAFDKAVALHAPKASSYYGRGLAERALGRSAASDADLAQARKLEPAVARRLREQDILRAEEAGPDGAAIAPAPAAAASTVAPS